MPLYDYACPCGTRFEMLVTSWSSPAPDCPTCGGETVRRPPSPAFGGRAAPPPAMSTAPQSWAGVGHGDAGTIDAWRRRVEARRDFEERHPEHKEHRDAVAAHEGAFERKPLTYKELAARASTSKDATAAAAEASRERTTPRTTPPES